MPHPRLLERSLLFTIAVHVLGMLVMAALLLPGVPGGGNLDIHARAAHVANQPWLWRIGWLPWQASALSDLLVCAALLTTPWISKPRAGLASVAMLAGFIPDQWSQVRWTWEGVDLARAAIASGNFDAYARFESLAFLRIGGWGTVGYLVGAVAWARCFAPTPIWSRGLTRLSFLTFGLFALATAPVFLAPELRNGKTISAAIAVGNAVAFILFIAWCLIIAERVMRLSRPITATGPNAAWRHPASGLLPRACDGAANSRVAREYCRLIPPLTMVSHITGVVYVNYLLDADALEPLVPAPLALQRLGPDGRFALFSFLTFRHGAFGPACLGPLRRLWPSPLQSNWRIHVLNPATGLRGVHFLSTAITGLPHALCTRLLADGVPMHIPRSASLEHNPGGAIRLALDPGAGSAPDATAEFAPCPTPQLEGAWRECFNDWNGFLAYVVPQDRALTVPQGAKRVVRQEITLDIPLESCRPLTGKIDSRSARAIAGDAQPLCFLVERAGFRFTAQRWDA